MSNFITNIIRDHKRILVGVSFVILLVACGNFIYINTNIKHNYKSSLLILQKLDSLSSASVTRVLKKTSTELSDTSSTISQIHQQADLPKEALIALRGIIDDMNTNKKGVFDSNTLTFLISFVLMGLIAIFLEVNKKVSDKISEFEQIAKKIKQSFQEESENMKKSNHSSQQQLDNFKKNYQADTEITLLIIKMQTIQLIAIQINIELTCKSLNLNGPLNEYARMIDNEVNDMIKKLNTGVYHYLSNRYKEKVLKILDKITALISPGNIIDKAKITPITLNSAYLHLQQLYERIVLLPTSIDSENTFSNHLSKILD